MNNDTRIVSAEELAEMIERSRKAQIAKLRAAYYGK